MKKEQGVLPQVSVHEAASYWNNPEKLLRIEQGRYPVQRALGRIVEGVFDKYVPVGVSILEVGAGQGYLKDLVPSTYHARYISSDYNAGNLYAGKKRRDLQAVVMSATELSLPDASVDVIVNMDAYDTLPDLSSAMAQAKRVLKPDGTFIHFQVNIPSDSTVWFDHPDMIFFPTGRGEKNGPQMVGIHRNDVIQGLDFLQTLNLDPHRGFIKGFLQDYRGMYHHMLSQPQMEKNSDVISEIINLMPGDKFDIPSLQEYFREKLVRTTTQSGLQVVESQYRGTSVVGPRSKAQRDDPNINEFEFTAGYLQASHNRPLAYSRSNNVIERASIMVVVAKK